MSRPGIRALVALGVFAAGCGGPPPIDRESLEAGEFLTADGSTITLVEGSTTGVDGETYELATMAEGDLDFDGETDAAVILVESRGEARILRLHAVVADGRSASDVSARLIGDRLGIERLTIEDGIIEVTLLIRRPGEPVAVAPSVRFSQNFVLTDGGLIPIVRTEVDHDDEEPMPTPSEMDDADSDEGGPVPRSDDASPAIYTHEWELAEIRMGDWTGDLSVLEQPVTVRFVAELADISGASGQFSGFGGCNQIFGSFRAEESEVLRIAGLAATRRACAPPLSDIEERFLTAFRSVGAFEISGDRLELRFVGGTLEFQAGGRLVPAGPEATDLEAPEAPEDEKRRQT